jgi:hypothetical protein
MTFAQDEQLLLPFCDKAAFVAQIWNGCDEPLEAQIRVQISFGVPGLSNAPLEPITYMGSIGMAHEYYEVCAIKGEIRQCRVFEFEFIGMVPGIDLVELLLPFTIEPHLQDAATVYDISVQFESLYPECEGLYTTVQEFTLRVVPGLARTPISGKVSDWINAGRLLSNSCSSATVEAHTVKDMLEVDVDYCFDGTSNNRSLLYLLPGTQIVVRPGVTLTLDEARVFTFDTLAKGILVETGGHLVAKNSSLEDCRFAIDAQANSTLRAEGNALKNNYVGMRFDMRGASSPARVSQLILGNAFTTTRPLKAPYVGMPEAVETRGYCGILLYDYDDFNVFGSQTNSFSQLANGIMGYNSTGNIGNITFEDLKSVDATLVYPREGYGIYLSSTASGRWFNVNLSWTSMAFSGVKQAVFSHNMAGKVEKIEATDVGGGIQWQRSAQRDVRLLNNIIRAKAFGIYSWGNEPLQPISAMRQNFITITNASNPNVGPARGIWMDEAGPAGALPLRGWQVTNNLITLQRGGTGIGYRGGVRGLLLNNYATQTSSTGLYHGLLCEEPVFSEMAYNTLTRSQLQGDGAGILNRGGSSSAYTCNIVDKTARGMQFQDMADLTDRVRGNRYNQHITGLQIDPGSAIGNQYHTGNRWNLQFIDPNQGILGGRCFGDIEQSRFYVDGSEDPAYLPVVDPSDWFFDELSPGTYQCDPPFEFGLETDDPTELDVLVASGGSVSEVYESEMTWKAAYRLYRKLLRQPELAQDSLYAAFQAYHETRSTGRLAAVAEAIGGLFALTAGQDSLLVLYRAEQEVKAEQLRQLDSLHYAGQSVSESAYQAAQEAGAEAREQYEAYADALITTRRAQAAALATQNSSIATDALPAANHKAVNAALLHLLQTDTLSAADVAALEDIAEQCPLEGGDAVYEARALLGGGVYYDDDALCGLAQWRSREVPRLPVLSQSAKEMLYPNPANGLLYWSGAQPVRIRLFNATGQLAIDQPLVGNALPIGLLPEGLYVAQVFDAQTHTLLAVQKVVLKR